MTDELLLHLKTALGEAYQLERELPGGGMSRVFVARDERLGREVVVKVLPPELAAGMNRERFRREVQLAARLAHPYIVPLLSAGESGELLWFTMPYISGTSLKERIEAGGPLGVAETVRLGHDVVEALIYAHSRGVMHRDIKPGNILIEGQHAMITDFGVAKALGAALPLSGVAGHTTSGMAIGTPAYMAPEQLAADPNADHRVDIYAVGLLLYEMLTGATPFAAASPTLAMTAQLSRVPEPLHSLRPEVPSALSELVAHCLAKNPADRPESANAVLAELERVSGALVVGAHNERVGNSGESSTTAPIWPVVAAAVSAMVLVAVGLWATLTRERSPATVVEPASAAVSTVIHGDSATSEPLNVSQVPLTRADSLAIAAALRDELDRIAPEQTSGSTAQTSGSSSVSLERQVLVADSLVRARLTELIHDRGVRGDQRNREEQSRAFRTDSVRRIMVLALPSRHGDSALARRSQELGQEIGSRLDQSSRWQLVQPPAGRPIFDSTGASPADVLLTLGLSPVGKDSVMLRVGVRNLEPGSKFGYRIIASPPAPTDSAGDIIARTIGEAMGALAEVRRGEAGTRRP